MKYLILLLLFIPIFILACPHFDEEGNLYYLYYEPDNPENIVMAYQREGHYQIYYYDEDSNITKEEFELKFFQSAELYHEYQFESDKPYLKSEITFVSEKFDLYVPLDQARKATNNVLDDETMLAFYIIETKMVNQMVNEEEHFIIENFLKDLEVEMLDLDIFYIAPYQTLHDLEWLVEINRLQNFEESITINYRIEEENLSVIRISELEDEYISISEVDFFIEEGQIIIETDQIGYYVFVSNQGEIKTGQFENERSEDFDNQKEVLNTEKENVQTGINVDKIILVVVIIVSFYLGYKLYIKK